MEDPTDPPRSSPVHDRSADRPPSQRKRTPRKPARKPPDAPSHLDQWYSDHLFRDPHNFFAWRAILAIGFTASACGVVSVVILVKDAPRGWELVLRLLATALVAVAVACSVLAYRRHPRPGYLKPTLIAVAALVAAVAVAAFAAWIT